MKNTKKLLALVLAVMLVLALSVPAWADESDTIKITVTVPTEQGADATAETYTAYKIFDATYDSNKTTEGGAGDGTVAYTISTTNPWYNIIVADTTLSGYFTLTKSPANENVYNVQLANSTNNTEEFAKTLAKALEAKINGENFTGDGQAISLTPNTASSVGKGFYLITSSLGSNLIVATTDIEIAQKNTYPTVAIETSDMNQNGYIGEEKTFVVKVGIPKTIDATKAVNLKINTGDGLSIMSVTAQGQTEAIVADGDGLYKIPDTFLSQAAAATEDTTTVKVDVKAKVTGSATIGKSADSKNKLNVSLEYSNYKTTATSAVVETYQFNLKKIDGTEKNALANVEFTLTKSVTTGDGGETSITTSYFKTDANDKWDAQSTKLTTNNDGMIEFKGIADGEYTLTETKALPGYNILANAITVTVSGGNVTVNNGGQVAAEGGIQILTVENNKGTELPSTGGIGTTIFTVVGGVLMVAAVIFFVTKRRVDAAE